MTENDRKPRVKQFSITKKFLSPKMKNEGEFSPDPLSSNRQNINEGFCKKMQVVPKNLFP